MMQGVREVAPAPLLDGKTTIKAETQLQRGRNSCKPAVKHGRGRGPTIAL